MQDETLPSQSRSTFVERRIEDAKKLFESKMQPPSSLALPSYGGSSSRYSSTTPSETFGHPPPLPSQFPPGLPLLPIKSQLPPHSLPDMSLGSIPIPSGRPPQGQRPSHSQQQEEGGLSQLQYKKDIFAEEDQFNRPLDKNFAGEGKKTTILPRMIYTKNHPSFRSQRKL